MLRKSFLWLSVSATLLCLPTLALSSQINELAVVGADDNRYGFDRVICVDGLKIFQTIAFGYGDGTGAAVSNIQLYEQKKGNVVPVRCTPGKTNKETAKKKASPKL